MDKSVSRDQAALLKALLKGEKLPAIEVEQSGLSIFMLEHMYELAKPRIQYDLLGDCANSQNEGMNRSWRRELRRLQLQKVRGIELRGRTMSVYAGYVYTIGAYLLSDGSWVTVDTVRHGNRNVFGWTLTQYQSIQEMVASGQLASLKDHGGRTLTPYLGMARRLRSQLTNSVKDQEARLESDKSTLSDMNKVLDCVDSEGW